MAELFYQLLNMMRLLNNYFLFPIVFYANFTFNAGKIKRYDSLQLINFNIATNLTAPSET